MIGSDRRVHRAPSAGPDHLGEGVTPGRCSRSGQGAHPIHPAPPRSITSRVAGEAPHLNTSNAPTRGGSPVFVHRRAATSLESQRSTLDASQSRTLARRSVKSSGGSFAITSHLNAW